MQHSSEDKRSQKRTYFEPSDMGHLLEATIGGKKYQFKVLNIGQGGIGMLVKGHQTEVLRRLNPGGQLAMRYTNPKGSMEVKVEIRHITPIQKGAFEGHYSIGFSMSI
jgi:hypothetical protein